MTVIKLLFMSLILSSCFDFGTEPDPFPSVIITTGNLNVTTDFVVTIDLSLASSDFAIGDITVTNGTKSAFTTVSSKQYTCVITPTISGNVILSIVSGSFTSSGYPNRQSNTLTVNYNPGGINARIFIIGGQSNVIPGGNNAGYMPSYLLPEIDVKIWNNAGEYWEYVNLAARTVKCWPVVKFAYDIKAKYPSDEIYVVQYGYSGSNLFSHWQAGGVLYNELLGFYTDALTTISDRNFIQKSFIFIQGETDTKTLSYANAYETKLTTLVSSARTDFDITKFVDLNVYVNLPAIKYPYSATVRTAKANVDAADANFYLADSDLWVFQSDDVHLAEDGVVSAGEYAASVL